MHNLIEGENISQNPFPAPIMGTLLQDFLLGQSFSGKIKLNNLTFSECTVL